MIVRNRILLQQWTTDSYKRIRNVHRLSGHKLEKNMIDMYKQSGKYDIKMKKIIQEVIKRCKTCQMKKKSQPRPKVSLMKAKSPNDIVTLDLKQFTVRGKKMNVLWMICEFSRLAIGRVIKSKEGKAVVSAIEEGWIYTWGCPSRGFLSDNCLKFKNQCFEDLCERWKIQLNCEALTVPGQRNE